MILVQSLVEITDDGLYSIPVLSLNMSRRPELNSDVSVLLKSSSSVIVVR